jgi:hypothetical protein
MVIIQAYQTSDGNRFYDVELARQHARTLLFHRLVVDAVRANPQFARLDPELLIEFLNVHGTAVGETADAPLIEEDVREYPKPAAHLHPDLTSALDKVILDLRTPR